MSAKRFRKKPVTVEAMQWTGNNSPAIASWSDLAFTVTDDEDREHTDDPEATASVYDRLHSTRVLVYTGDWIIKGISGEFYPCRPDVFAATYDAVPA